MCRSVGFYPVSTGSHCQISTTCTWSIASWLVERHCS